MLSDHRELSDPRRAVQLGLGLSSPLWPSFFLAAGAGVAFWAFSRWGRRPGYAELTEFDGPVLLEGIAPPPASALTPLAEAQRSAPPEPSREPSPERSAEPAVAEAAPDAAPEPAPVAADPAIAPETGAPPAPMEVAAAALEQPAPPKARRKPANPAAAAAPKLAEAKTLKAAGKPARPAGPTPSALHRRGARHS